MGVIEKVIVSDETLRRLEDEARRNGHTVAQEAALRIENEASRPSREEMLERLRAFRESLPAQTTDSLTLLREDRDR
ncbi:MAG: hypothetical protein HY834_08415 [Devosia nanyangense]|uniref:Uncharacterized protein n=1 Tax=Devosia nanyangense TaxID=1228055 RepID=A0A933L011_9HYPH|nr:hypothetical protein [Devosia nanyangense]